MAIRTRTVAGATGSYSYKGPLSQSSGNTECTALKSTCSDTGLWNKPMTIDHYSNERVAMSKEQWLNTLHTQWKITRNFVPSSFRAIPVIAHLTDPSRPTNAELSVMLRERLNPNYSNIDLPVSIFELRELPALLYEVGKASLKAFAKGNLTFQFGVMPVVSDLVKLVEFGKAFEKRYEDFRKLRDKGGYLRKVKLWDGSVHENGSSVITTNSSPSTFFCSHRLVSTVTTRSVWGYGTILADSSFNPRKIDDRQLKFLTRRAVLGSNLSLSAAWNALPWSWLIDWFSDIGSFLAANKGGIPHSVVGMAICETTETNLNYSLESSNFGFVKNEHECARRRITKAREAPSGLLPSFHLPFLTVRQSGILGSLALLRTR